MRWILVSVVLLTLSVYSDGVPGPSGTPEAVLDWGGGGGGQRPQGAHDCFLSGAHQWRRQLFGMEGGGGTICIAHRTRGSICYHNFPNILLVYLLSSHLKKKKNYMVVPASEPKFSHFASKTYVYFHQFVSKSHICHCPCVPQPSS